MYLMYNRLLDCCYDITAYVMVLLWLCVCVWRGSKENNNEVSGETSDYQRRHIIAHGLNILLSSLLLRYFLTCNG